MHEKNLKRLEMKTEDLILYKAGLPKFDKPFARDMIISALLFNDSDMLKDSLRFCAMKQGTKKDRITGEEPGKIFHEWPGVTIEGRGKELTTYNASETTALFLIGIYRYENLTGDDSLRIELDDNIKRAVSYIFRHIDYRGLFIEDPSFSGAENYALRVTYWKDSHLIDRSEEKPSYPVVYPLVHIQYIDAVRSISRIYDDDSLAPLLEKMRSGLSYLIDNQGIFCLALDDVGMISGISSDLLHILYYLEEDDLSALNDGFLDKIREKVKVLETDIGYRTLDPSLKYKLNNTYHTSTVWPFEQAVIHEGVSRLGMEHEMSVAARIMKVIDDNDAEIFNVSDDGKSYEEGGCNPQLWTIAARKYFNHFRG